MIITEYAPPPIPTRNFDWRAYSEDHEENIGFGRTKQEAIDDLQNKIDLCEGVFEAMGIGSVRIPF